MNKTFDFSIKSIPQSSHRRGFTAVIAVLLIAGGISALSLSALGAAVSYADQMFRWELRIQSGLDEASCQDTAVLIRVKDAFVSGHIRLDEFDCDLYL